MLYNQLKIRVFVSLLHENEPDIVTEGAGTLPFCTAIDLQEPRMDKKRQSLFSFKQPPEFSSTWLEKVCSARGILWVVICNVTSGSHQIGQLNSYPEHKFTHTESCQCQKPLAVTLMAARHSDRCRWLLHWLFSSGLCAATSSSRPKLLQFTIVIEAFTRLKRDMIILLLPQSWKNTTV